jgi:hypothetical protein
MTTLKHTPKPRWRQTAAEERGRPVCVALQPHSLLLRLKGKRMILEMPFASAWTTAAGLAARVEIAPRFRRNVRRGALVSAAKTLQARLRKDIRAAMGPTDTEDPERWDGQS